VTSGAGNFVRRDVVLSSVFNFSISNIRRKFARILFAFVKAVTRKSFPKKAIGLSIAYNIGVSALRETYLDFHRFVWGIPFDNVPIESGTAKGKRRALNELNFHFLFLLACGLFVFSFG
jgi:hypothetical protein